MLNFPVPYPDELLYSTVARAGVHYGITSPKQLLDEVFGDRKVVATVDLPSHVDNISQKYPSILDLTPETLIYNHTLFPLYAPFIPEERRIKAFEAMVRRAKGSVHLTLGITTSLVRRSKHFRICPGCLEEQLAKYGEYYWTRQWQVTGARYCIKHAELSETKHTLHQYHRHAFVPLAPSVICFPRTNSSPHNKRVEKRVQELLNLPPTQSPALEQWSFFYKEAARTAGITRKSKVIFESLKHLVLSNWTTHRLTGLGIPITNNSSNWLRLIMRKHRKAFSYLQHIVLLESLLGPKWHFNEIISQVQNQTRHPQLPTYSPPKHISQSILHAKRQAWLQLVQTKGTRKARSSGGDSIYTWLYRNDRNWLKQISDKYRKTTRSDNRRVDWEERDRLILERLKAVKRTHANKIDSPRKSKNWYCAQADCQHMVRKIDKLPLVAAFLEENSEDVANYQIRRIALVMKNHKSSIKLPYWRLLRQSGLSDQRLKPQTRKFLRQMGWPA